MQKSRPGGRVVGANQKESIWRGKFGCLTALLASIDVVLAMIMNSITEKGRFWV